MGLSVQKASPEFIATVIIIVLLIILFIAGGVYVLKEGFLEFPIETVIK